MERIRLFKWLAIVISIFVAGCGGGRDGIEGTGLAGTVATGAPVANATVELRDKNGEMRTTTTDAGGKYAFDTTHLTPPFLYARP